MSDFAEQSGNSENEDLADNSLPDEENPDSIQSDAADDPHNPEFYLKQIPMTPEAMETSNEVVAEGLFNMGIILKTNSKTIRRPSPTSTYWKSGSPRTPTDSTYTITCTSCTCVTEMSSPQGYTGIRFVLYSPKAPMRKLWPIRIIWIICDA